MVSRHQCFTLNNYTDADLALLRHNRPAYVRYVTFGFEISASGTPHLQGYVEFDAPKRVSTLKNWLPTAHWEARLGSREQARDYCRKGTQPKSEWYSTDGYPLHADGQAMRERGPTFGADAVFEDHGKFDAGGAGKRTDIQGAVDRLYAGESLEAVALSDPALYCRARNGLKDFKMWSERQRAWTFRNVEVHVIWGAAGKGKSRATFDYANARDCCVATPSSECFPLGTYDGESCIVLNDFYGQIKLAEFLNITDGHYYAINTKGGYRYALYTKVYITSNVAPELWYAAALANVPDVRAAFMRRLTSVHHIGDDGTLEDCMIAAGRAVAIPTPLVTNLEPALNDDVNDISDNIGMMI